MTLGYHDTQYPKDTHHYRKDKEGSVNMLALVLYI